MSSVRFGRCSVVVTAITVIAMLALAGSASAQTASGAISGTVVDPQDQVVPGATITIINEATKDTRVATSDSERGSFQITGLIAGTYTVRVSLQGFGTFERKNVVVSSSDRVSG